MKENKDSITKKKDLIKESKDVIKKKKDLIKESKDVIKESKDVVKEKKVKKTKKEIREEEGMVGDDSIKQRDINNAAWAACDTFRGIVDAAGYKDYILVILFIKYVSDVWNDHYMEYHKQYPNDISRIQRKLDRERLILPQSANFYTLYERRNDSNIGELINMALESIEEKNKEKLYGVFRNIDFNSDSNLGKTKDRNRRLKMLLEDFHKPELNMGPSRVAEDVIGNTYIYLIEKFASDAGRKAGEFYTPHKASQLIARLCDPKPGARICDPACGSGGLLIEAGKTVGTKDYSLYGMEVNGSTWALCRMNMFLHGVDSADIRWCNTLTSPGFTENDSLMRFDNIVANPPFSLDKWGADQAQSDPYNRFWRGVPPKTKGDYAFISHMIESAARQKGRVSVVVSHGVLFRGASEGRIREQLIRENILDAVIGLPDNLFPTTTIPVAILVFDRSRESGGAREKVTNVFFIDASRHYEPGKNKNALLEEHIEKILSVYKERKDVDKYARLIDFPEIEENDFNLNIPRYVDNFEEEPEIDIQSVQDEIQTLRSEVSEANKNMDAILMDLMKANRNE